MNLFVTEIEKVPTVADQLPICLEVWAGTASFTKVDVIQAAKFLLLITYSLRCPSVKFLSVSSRIKDLCSRCLVESHLRRHFSLHDFRWLEDHSSDLLRHYPFYIIPFFLLWSTM